MPVNYQQIREQVKKFGQDAPRLEGNLKERRLKALDVLKAYAQQLDKLQERVDQALVRNSNLRCARPTKEHLDKTFALPQIPGLPVLLAADGSQINPDRHDPVEFAVINLGAIRFLPGQPQRPLEIVRSQLLYGDVLYTPSGPLTEDLVALRRDLSEREMLAELAAAEAPPVITLTDGPLELYGEPRESEDYKKTFQKYLETLGKLAAMKTIVAGYVDKPKADLVVRLLELTIISDQELAQANRLRPLRPIVDADLFREALQFGERSAIFSIQSPSAQKFEGVLSLHFFYVNVGQLKPYLARVEIPQWVASDAHLLDLLHASILAQCSPLGNRPFPYALHRAHEVAVVGREEKSQIVNMIQVELRRQGVDAGESSNKQFSKDQMGHKQRYSP